MKIIENFVAEYLDSLKFVSRALLSPIRTRITEKVPSTVALEKRKFSIVSSELISSILARNYNEDKVWPTLENALAEVQRANEEFFSFSEFGFEVPRAFEKQLADAISELTRRITSIDKKDLPPKARRKIIYFAEQIVESSVVLNFSL